MDVLYFQEKRLQELLEKCSLIIFDMNGLIIDDEGIQLKAVNHVLNKYHIQITEQYWIDECVGRKADEFFKTIMKRYNVQSENYSVIKLIHEKNEIYKTLMSKNIKQLVRPGVNELIHYLSQSSQHQLAIATSASESEIQIILGEEGLNLLHQFQCIVSKNMIQKSKPHPEIYQKVSECLNINPSDCLVLEDASPGVNSAHNAGMKCLAIPNQFTLNHDFRHAIYVINNLTRDAKIV